MEKVKDQTVCCPEFEPALWDGKIVEWKNKAFVKDKICTFFYMPLNFGCIMKKMTRKIEKAGVSMSENIFLSDHTSMWNMNLYIAVDKIATGAENTLISGKFLCKVYEGPFKETGKWCKDFEEYAKGQSIEISKTYMWYTTCPKCAKKYGKNYVVILGQIK
ncbi:MAG: hypothetical protein PHS30_01165 [Bacteroidales bacterium]|nr:hypothetical protein [Bacteroidales bacterium]